MATDETIKSPDEVSATLEQAYYDLMTEARLARVGLKERQETAPIVARYEALYTKRQIEALRGEMERAGEDGERREELTRLHNALLEGYVEARVAALDDEVVSSFAAATAEVDGETYPFHALTPAISITDDAFKRERLFEGVVRVVAPRDALLGQLHQETERAMAELGYASCYDFYAAVKRVDYPRFAAVVADALERTNGLYEQHVAPWVQEQVGRPLDGLSNAHTYWLRRNQAPAHLFPKDRMAEALRGSLAAMGVNLDAQDNILIDAEDRPSKNPRACVFPARVPTEVHLIIKPTGGKGDYDAFFHEAGHAEHYANADPALPFAFRMLSASMAQPELFSYLMENLVNDLGWLETYLGLAPADARFVAHRAALSDLMLFRRYCAKYLYEYTYFTQGGDGPALYAGNLRRYTGFAYPPALWQYDRDSGFYAADYLRAWFGHAQVVTALRSRYGVQWWADKRAGADVRALWRRGVRPEIEDIVRELRATPWDAAALAGYYAARLAR